MISTHDCYTLPTRLPRGLPACVFFDYRYLTHALRTAPPAARLFTALRLLLPTTYDFTTYYVAAIWSPPRIYYVAGVVDLYSLRFRWRCYLTFDFTTRRSLFTGYYRLPHTHVYISLFCSLRSGCGYPHRTTTHHTTPHHTARCGYDAHTCPTLPTYTYLTPTLHLTFTCDSFIRYLFDV